MDDDDYYTDFDFFIKGFNILSKNEDISFVSSSSIVEYVNKNIKEKSLMNINGKINNIDYLTFFQTKYTKSNSTFTTIFRRRSLEEANFSSVKMVNDSSIYLRALLSGDAYILDCICGVYRVHSNNITSNLTVNFIIENLIEKRNIYDEIVSRKLFTNSTDWLNKQVYLTVSYYLQNNIVSKNDFLLLYNWCIDNVSKDFADSLIKLKNGERK